MSKIALVIGHNARSQGAVRVTDKRTEYDINSDLAAAIRELDPSRYVGVPPVKWSTHRDMFIPFSGGLEDGWQAREARRYRSEAASG